MLVDPGLPRKSLAVAAKHRVSNEETSHHLNRLKSLPRQGSLIRSTTHGAAAVWAKVIDSFPDEPFKYVLNAAHDTLPHNTIFHLLKKACDLFPLCASNRPQFL